MTETSERLEQIFAELMVAEQTPVRDRTKLNCLTWDSLMQLNVVLAIEQEFQVRLSDAEAVELNSFAGALALVEGKRTARSQDHAAGV